MRGLSFQVKAFRGHDQRVVHDSVEFFDPEQGVWQEARPMLQRRSGASCAVLGGALVLLGGNDGSQVLNTVEAYDPEEDLWPLGVGGERCWKWVKNVVVSTVLCSFY